MATGIVCGRVLDAAEAPAVGIRVVLDNIHISGQERTYGRGMQADGLRIQGRTTLPSCPPYGIAAETNDQGDYILLYDWAEDFAGEIANSLRFRVMCFDPGDPQYPFLGDGRGIGMYGLDLRTMLSQFLPLDTLSHWTSLILAAQRAFPSRWHREHTTEGTRRVPRQERGIQYTPQGAPRTTPPGAVPRPPPPQGPEPMHPRGPGSFAQGALGESVGGGRYMLLTRIDVRLRARAEDAGS
jgi:hypothetical protein